MEIMESLSATFVIIISVHMMLLQHTPAVTMEQVCALNAKLVEKLFLLKKTLTFTTPVSMFKNLMCLRPLVILNVMIVPMCLKT